MRMCGGHDALRRKWISQDWFFFDGWSCLIIRFVMASFFMVRSPVTEKLCWLAIILFWPHLHLQDINSEFNTVYVLSIFWPFLVLWLRWIHSNIIFYYFPGCESKVLQLLPLFYLLWSHFVLFTQIFVGVTKGKSSSLCTHPVIYSWLPFMTLIYKQIRRKSVFMTLVNLTMRLFFFCKSFLFAGKLLQEYYSCGIFLSQAVRSPENPETHYTVPPHHSTVSTWLSWVL